MKFEAIIGENKLIHFELGKLRYGCKACLEFLEDFSFSSSLGFAEQCLYFQHHLQRMVLIIVIRSITVRPSMVEGHANLASAYKDSGHVEAST